MNHYRVTFVANYFVLSTTVGIESDTEVADEVIIETADDLIMREHDFSPSNHAYDVEIEEVSI